VTASTNTDWTQSVGELCLSAAVELGAVGMGDSLEASEELEMISRLNGMIAKWSIDTNMFREETGTLTVVGGTGAATLPSGIRDIRGVRHVQSSTYKRTLAVWNRDEFMSLPNRTQAGDPTIFYYSQRIGGDQIYLWPVPAAAVTLELDYNRTFYFAEDSTQTLDLPSEWLEAALYGLAARCANMFGAAEIDPAKVGRIDNQAKATYEKLLDSDRPDSYYFEYDSPVEAR
jgi:hypothetical protein